MKPAYLATGSLLTLGLLNACQTTKPANSTTTVPAVQKPIWQSDAYSL